MRTKTKLILIKVLLVGVLVSMLFTGCATKQSATIKVGVIVPLTGSAPAFGASARNGCEMAVNEVNAKGGVLGKTVEMIVADDKNDVTEGVNAAQKLIYEENVIAITGVPLSRVALPVAKICQITGTPMISSVATNPMVTEVGDYIFRACFIDSFQGAVAADFAFSNLKAKKVGVLYDYGDAYAKGLAEFFQKQFLALGGTVTAFEAYPTGAVSFTSYLKPILAQKPEAIFCPNLYTDDALIAKEARGLGYTGPFVGGDGWDSPDLFKIGKDAVNNTYFVNHFSKDDASPDVQTFVKNYTEKYGEAPDVEAVLDYDAMRLLLQAIQNAGSTDGANIRDSMKNIEYHGITGLIKFDKNRNPIKSAVIIKIENGRQVYVTTINPQ
jgi:branched-chain amino acid transport system substrate-binding protein